MPRVAVSSHCVAWLSSRSTDVGASLGVEHHEEIGHADVERGEASTQSAMATGANRRIRIGHAGLDIVGLMRKTYGSQVFPAPHEPEQHQLSLPHDCPPATQQWSLTQMGSAKGN